MRCGGKKDQGLCREKLYIVLTVSRGPIKRIVEERMLTRGIKLIGRFLTLD